MNNSKKSEKNPAANALEAVYVDESVTYRELTDTAEILLEEIKNIGCTQVEFSRFDNEAIMYSLISLGGIAQNNSEIISKIISLLFHKMREAEDQNKDLALKVVNLQATIERLSKKQAEKVRGNA